MPEYPQASKSVNSLKHTIKLYTGILSNKLFIAYVSLFALLAYGQWCFLTVAPFFYANKMQLSEDKIGFYISLSALFFILGASLTTQLVQRFGVDKLLHTAIKLPVLSGITLLVFYFLDIVHPALIAITFGCYLFNIALLWGICTSRALQCYEHQRGAASAIRSLLMISFFASGSSLGTLINSEELLGISVVLILFSIGSIMLYAAVILKNQALSEA